MRIRGSAGQIQRPTRDGRWITSIRIDSSRPIPLQLLSDGESTLIGIVDSVKEVDGEIQFTAILREGCDIPPGMFPSIALDAVERIESESGISYVSGRLVEIAMGSNPAWPSGANRFEYIDNKEEA